jgi:hypothetical protein
MLQAERFRRVAISAVMVTAIGMARAAPLVAKAAPVGPKVGLSEE